MLEVVPIQHKLMILNGKNYNFTLIIKTNKCSPNIQKVILLFNFGIGTFKKSFLLDNFGIRKSITPFQFGEHKNELFTLYISIDI